MNPRALQQAIVRMMYDPAFLAAVHGARPVPGLGEAERALLRRVDRRAFATDPFRRARAVQALVEEFPASAAAIGLPRVDAFLSSPAFHACVTGRGALALAFATWLKDQAGGAGAIEAALADLRRRPPVATPGPTAPRRRPPAATPDPAASPRDGSIAGALVCSPRFAPLLVPAGTLEWYEATRAWLGPTPLQRLAEHGPRPSPPRRGRPRGVDDEALLLEAGGDGDMSLGTASPALVHLLRHAGRPRTRAVLEAEAVARGATPREAPEVIDDLLADGLLVPA